MLEMRKVSKIFYGKNRAEVLNQVDFELKEGEITGLTGRSGSGKSTLARLLLQLEKPDSGHIFYKGKAMNQKNVENLRNFAGRSNTFPSIQSPFLIPSGPWDGASGRPEKSTGSPGRLWKSNWKN